MSSATAQPHSTRLRVRYAETDQMGVVYHANYLVWMEIGRVELVRARGCDYKDMEREGFFLSVVAVECHYRYPARFDDEILIETQVQTANARVVQFAYLIKSAADGRLLAEGSTKHLWLNRNLRPTRLPYQYLGYLEQGPRNDP